MRKVAAARFANCMECTVSWAEGRLILVKLDWGRGVVRIRRIIRLDLGKPGSCSQPQIRSLICEAAFIAKWRIRQKHHLTGRCRIDISPIKIGGEREVSDDPDGR